jgi:hypothetical protein
MSAARRADGHSEAGQELGRRLSSRRIATHRRGHRAGIDIRLAGLQGIRQAAPQSGGNAHILGLLSRRCVFASGAHRRIGAPAGGREDPCAFMRCSTAGIRRRRAPSSMRRLSTRRVPRRHRHRRYYAMDRDNRWDRVENGLSRAGRGRRTRGDRSHSAIEAAYAVATTDESPPAVTGGWGGRAPTVGC